MHQTTEALLPAAAENMTGILQVLQAIVPMRTRQQGLHNAQQLLCSASLPVAKQGGEPTSLLRSALA